MNKAAILGLLAVSLSAQTPTCATVEGDQIRGSDLARAIPGFRRIPPDAPLAPAPPPGGSRVFTPSELQTLAERFSIDAESFPETCFRLFTEQLRRDRVLEAMRASLQTPGARIELLEVSSEKAPRGRIEFPLDGLGKPALADRSSPVLWRGAVMYGNPTERFPVWARVAVAVPVSRVIAVESLRPGVAIEPRQLRTEVADGFPVEKQTPDIGQIAGMLPLRPIAAGAEVRKEYLAKPLDVHRGDRVNVEVRIGATHLALNGRAEADGHVGEVIAVLNPDSNKTFRARVDGKGRVVVEPADAGR